MVDWMLKREEDMRRSAGPMGAAPSFQMYAPITPMGGGDRLMADRAIDDLSPALTSNMIATTKGAQELGRLSGMSGGDMPLQPPDFLAELMLGGGQMGAQAAGKKMLGKLPAMAAMLKGWRGGGGGGGGGGGPMPPRGGVVADDIADLPPLPPPGRPLTEAELAAEEAAKDAAFEALGRTSPQRLAAMGRRQNVSDLPPLPMLLRKKNP